MAWMKASDNSDEHPKMLAVMSLVDIDERTFNEVLGFILRLYLHSGAHLTDYVVSYGAALTKGGSLNRANELIEMSVAVGLLETFTKDGQPMLRLMQDPDGNFFNLQMRKDVEWARTRRNDNANPNLKFGVLVRDGDNCRWCGQSVYWTGKMSPRKGTLDHLKPGEPGTVETMIVSCVRCNGARGDDTTGDWDHAHELLPVPDRPVYSKWTFKQLLERGYIDEQGNVRRSASGNDTRALTPSTCAGQAKVNPPKRDPHDSERAEDSSATAPHNSQPSTGEVSLPTRVPHDQGERARTRATAPSPSQASLWVTRPDAECVKGASVVGERADRVSATAPEWLSNNRGDFDIDIGSTSILTSISGPPDIDIHGSGLVGSGRVRVGTGQAGAGSGREAGSVPRAGRRGRKKKRKRK